ncbi:MAG: PLDc N-terminal domain-containing protein [Candidatus Nanopelagicales bacterium]|jgi:hypothetical protein
MLRVVGLLLLVAVYIYFVIDVIRTPRGEVRSLPKVVWLLVVVFVPIVGGLLWLWLGRDWPSFGFRFGRRAPLAPDDDPAFLKQLGDEVWSERMRQRRGDDTRPSE